MIKLVIWKDVEGFEGLYRVSSEGVLVSTPRYGTKGGVVKRYKMAHGYEEYHLYKNAKLHHVYVHRLLAKYFIPNPENKPHVNHIDGNPMNNSLNNLEWVTHKENIQHASKIGRVKSGENHHNVKLTNQEVLEIRDLYKNKIYNQRELGEIYGVFQTHVSFIVRNKSRKVVEN